MSRAASTAAARDAAELPDDDRDGFPAEVPDLWASLYYDAGDPDVTFPKAFYTEERAVEESPGCRNLYKRAVRYVPAERVQALVDLVRKLDGNSYPIAPQPRVGSQSRRASLRT